MGTARTAAWLALLALAMGARCKAALSPPPSHVARGDGARADVMLADGWRFIRADVPGARAPGFADAAWTPVTLPHTWNALDGQDGGNDYHRGIGWYRRQLALPAAYAGRRVYLQFDAASMVADLWVNGTHVGQHRGGFAGFRFDVTSLVHPGGSDVVAVKVSNQAAADVPPLQGDFTLFGGLYRDVHVIAVDPVHVNLDDLGSSGVFHNVERQRPAASPFAAAGERWRRPPRPRRRGRRCGRRRQPGRHSHAPGIAGPGRTRRRVDRSRCRDAAPVARPRRSPSLHGERHAQSRAVWSTASTSVSGSVASR